MHLATHGFFAPAGLKSALAGSATERSGGGKFHGPASPSAKISPACIRVCCRAWFWPGPINRPRTGKDDGILTALEVSQLDLSHVELATLSACETGLGDTAGGEGLLGLQRAFQLSGAKSVMATLWTIRDDASRSLMIDFYENLWKKKMTKSEALRQAQLSMLRDGIKRGMEFQDNQPPDKNKRLPPVLLGPLRAQRRLAITVQILIVPTSRHLTGCRNAA